MFWREVGTFSSCVSGEKDIFKLDIVTEMRRMFSCVCGDKPGILSLVDEESGQRLAMLAATWYDKKSLGPAGTLVEK